MGHSTKPLSLCGLLALALAVVGADVLEDLTAAAEADVAASPVTAEELRSIPKDAVLVKNAAGESATVVMDDDTARGLGEIRGRVVLDDAQKWKNSHVQYGTNMRLKGVKGKLQKVKGKNTLVVTATEDDSLGQSAQTGNWTASPRFLMYDNSATCSGSPTLNETMNPCTWHSIYNWDPLPLCLHTPQSETCCHHCTPPITTNCYPGDQTCHASRNKKNELQWQQCSDGLKLRLKLTKANGAVSYTAGSTVCGQGQCCTYCNAFVRPVRGWCASSSQRTQSQCTSMIGSSSCSGGNW